MSLSSKGNTKSMRAKCHWAPSNHTVTSRWSSRSVGSSKFRTRSPRTLTNCRPFGLVSLNILSVRRTLPTKPASEPLDAQVRGQVLSLSRSVPEDSVALVTNVRHFVCAHAGVGLGFRLGLKGGNAHETGKGLLVSTRTNVGTDMAHFDCRVGSGWGGAGV